MAVKRFFVSKWVFTIFVLAVMTASILFVRSFRKAWSLARPADPEKKEAPIKVKGKPSAKVYVVEYSDFQCPACSYAAKALKRYYEKHASEMYVEFRHYPISKLHPYGITAAVAAECAARQGKFWDYHDRLFKTQRQWARSLDVGKALAEMAEKAGMDKETFQACREDSLVEVEVLKEKLGGQLRSVMATPTFFINGRMVVGGRSFEEEMDKIFSGEEE